MPRKYATILFVPETSKRRVHLGNTAAQQFPHLRDESPGDHRVDTRRSIRSYKTSRGAASPNLMAGSRLRTCASRACCSDIGSPVRS